MNQQMIHFFAEQFDFQFRFEIYFIVVFCALTILLFLAVLAHHDDGCLYSGNTG